MKNRPFVEVTQSCYENTEAYQEIRQSYPPRWLLLIILWGIGDPSQSA